MTEKKKAKTKKPVAKKLAKKAAPAPAKNPFKLNDQAWDRAAVIDVLCNALACSSKSMGTILKQGYQGHALPDYATVARWLAERDDEGKNPLYDQYLLAKEAQADYMAEELAELHEKAWVPAYDKEGNVIYGENGRIIMTVSQSSAAIVRLEAENKKWLMGKLKPKRFSDKNTHEHVGPNGGAIQIASTVTFVEPPPRPEDDEL